MEADALEVQTLLPYRRVQCRGAHDRQYSRVFTAGDTISNTSVSAFVTGTASIPGHEPGNSHGTGSGHTGFTYATGCAYDKPGSFRGVRSWCRGAFTDAPVSPGDPANRGIKRFAGN